MKNKNQEELKKEIELWKKKYYTAQKVFCEHNDKVKENFNKLQRPRVFYVNTDNSKEIEKLKAKFKKYSKEHPQPIFTNAFYPYEETIKKIKVNFQKKIEELKTYLNSFYGENNGWCKKIDEIFSKEDNHNPQTGHKKGFSGDYSNSAPEDVCAKQKGDFQEIKLRDVNFDDIVLCKKFKPKKEKGCGKE